jgi:phosphoribosylaminoimidazolecarboxamide formyltransferase/IMP cyclohydrolase
MSAYGGVIAFNRPVDAALAERLHANFIEVLIAPGYEPAGLEVLQRKESIRILEATEQRSYEPRERDVKRVRGGLLVQDPDRITETRETMEVVSRVAPREDQWRDLLFAWRVCRHVRSNAIVLAKDGATIGVGAGQMSRVDSVRIAIDKAHEARGEEAAALLGGSSLASDAFFPFADGPRTAIDAGASAFIQPGGSVRDDEVIAAVDEAGAAMVFTGRRHFRH